MNHRIKSLGEDVFADVVALRRHFHANPELSFQETRTAKTVASRMQEMGCEVETGVGGNGVVAHLTGAHPGRCIALRADMDALPISEANDFDFASSNPGVMHACGHDAHMASLLGAAMILSGMRDELAGTVRFIFQPAEEKAPGGARRLVEEGVLEERGRYARPEAILGQHVKPDLPVGSMGVRPGPFMASTDEIHIEVTGEGGHAAEPHRLAADAVYVSAQIVVALQSVISRHCPPGVPSILTIGRIEAEGATNIIPGGAFLRGTFRSMDPGWRSRGRDLIVRVVENVARAHGASAICRFEEGYPVLVNDARLAQWVSHEASGYLGREHVVDLDMWYAAEDFAYYAEVLPSCFYILGVGNEGAGITSGLHTPTFTIDEDALRTGAGLMAYLACRFTSGSDISDLPGADGQ